MSVPVPCHEAATHKKRQPFSTRADARYTGNMARPNTPRQNNPWRDTRSDRQHFERHRSRPDREEESPPMPITDEMSWAYRAAIVRDLRALVQTTWQARNKSEAAGDAWRETARQYQAVLEHAFRPDFLMSVDALQNRRQTDIEPILAFLEAEPYFYRSGYMTQNVLRWLKRLSFSVGDADRVRALVLRSVRRPGWSTRAFREYARLAAAVDSSELRVELLEASCSADSKVNDRGEARAALPAVREQTMSQFSARLKIISQA